MDANTVDEHTGIPLFLLRSKLEKRIDPLPPMQEQAQWRGTYVGDGGTKLAPPKVRRSA